MKTIFLRSDDTPENNRDIAAWANRFGMSVRLMADTRFFMVSFAPYGITFVVPRKALVAQLNQACYAENQKQAHLH